MSYLVLARKWRPRIFSEMVGQEHVLRALINALDSDRLHHAYLFTGTRGVGKTTIARILAKCLNCEKGVSSEPCGECSACCSIAEGRFIDLIEVDAASRTKVEDTRELLENVQYAPTMGRFKVYLIDEVHMLSTHSFNALLKTLEEPPPHVKFLLATTDPQKLPVTILSRCLQFNLKNLSQERIVHYLQDILAKEQVPTEEAGLWALARAADGSMRDALSLTDQAIAHGGGKLSEAEISLMLGAIDLTAIADISRALANNDSAEVLSVVETMSEHAPDYSIALADLLSVWHRVAIAQTVPDALDNRHGDYQLIQELAKALTREDVQLFYQIVLLGRRDLPLAPDPRVGFEMVMLRMLAFQPVRERITMPTLPREDAQESEQLAPGQKKLSPASGIPLETNKIFPSEGVDAPVKKSKANEALLSFQQQASNDQTVLSQQVDSFIPHNNSLNIVSGNTEKLVVIEKAWPLIDRTLTLDQEAEELTRAEWEVEASDEIENQLSSSLTTHSGAVQISTPITLDEFQAKHWIEVYQGLPIGGVLQNIAANLVLNEVRQNHLSFILDKNHSSLYDVAQQQRLADMLTKYFGLPVKVDITIGVAVSETPQACRLRVLAERKAAAIDSLNNDPSVRRIIDLLDGVLLEKTVKPLD